VVGDNEVELVVHVVRVRLFLPFLKRENETELTNALRTKFRMKLQYNHNHRLQIQMWDQKKVSLGTRKKFKWTDIYQPF
jgi:hypothetical protein